MVAALYMAADPEPYLTGTVKLFPKTHQAQIEDALRASGHALKLWLLGQLVSMSLSGCWSASGRG